MNKTTENKGITLIALVITIIVLLILAAVTLNIVLGENGIFGKSRLAKEKAEYTSAKETLDLKLVDIQTECAIEGKGYTIDEIANELETDTQILIEKYYAKSSARVSTNAVEKPTEIKGIVVSVEKYSRFKFLIGEEGKIIGATKGNIPNIWTSGDLPEGFSALNVFEGELGGIGDNGATSEPQTPPKEETKTVGGVDENTNASEVADIREYIIVERNSQNEIEVDSLVTGVTITQKSKTSNISINNNTITVNNSADSRDKCEVEITGTFKGQPYKNTLTAYIEPQRTTKVKNISDVEVDGYAIYTPEDLLRYAEIINNVDNTKNAKVMVSSLNLSTVCSSTIGNWPTIGTPESRFNGTFDGNKATIDYIYVKDETESETNVKGLFGVIGENGYVQKVIIGSNSYIYGYIVGRIAGVNLGNIIYCKNNAGITGIRDIGGIAGHNNGKIMRCINNGNTIMLELINPDSTIGGITICTGGGVYALQGKVAELRECINNGNINYTSCAATTGISNSGNNGGSGKVFDCINNGIIQGASFSGTICAVRGYLGSGEVNYCYNKSTSEVNLGGYGGVGSNCYSNDLTNTTVANLNNNRADGPWVADTNNINGGYPILSWTLSENSI